MNPESAVRTHPRTILGEGRRLILEQAENVAMLARIARELPGRLRHPIDPDEARVRVQHALETREQAFLTTVERLIYDHRRSPYLALLRQAGCELGDVQRLVAHEGVEGALTVLAAQGVYVTYDEFKGRREIVRGSARFRFTPSDFDNPRDRAALAQYTGGSGGRPSRVGFSMRNFDDWADTMALVFRAHGVERSPIAVWIGVSIIQAIVSTMAGQRVVGSFMQVYPIPPIAWAAAGYLALVARLAGSSLPIPRRMDLTETDRMAAWLLDQLAVYGRFLLWTVPSAAVRLSLAVQRTARRLDGLTFLLSSEPTTDARRAQIEASGARALVVYASVESAGLSYGCASPGATDDVHLQSHRFTIVQRTRSMVQGEPPVMAGLVTSLSLRASKVLLNCELGDHMRIEERDCGCLLGEIGLRTHLSEIRSFEKLTGEGVSFARSNIEQILEARLPARFGGGAVDYQLAEEETPSSAVRLVLRISPTVGPIDEAAVRDALLEGLASQGPIERYHAEIWQRVDAVEIRRATPIVTRAGKVLPFQPLRRVEIDRS
jgi:phenylacetate-coenzyme A ligase PaaK-like adenylate-forming protein